MVDEQSEKPDAELPPRRVVLLGASNLTRSFATVVDNCHRLWGQPLDCLASLGHGRSYGQRSTVLGRSLPSILHCDLWSALAERGPGPTAALVTDIGNDLMYESPVERIVEWVTRCLDKLESFDARIVMTRLPVANIEHVPEWKFRLLRRAMFPLGTLPFATIAERAHKLDARLAAIAAQRRITLVEQHRDWYGWDPIHLKRQTWPAVWHHILSGWSDEPTPAPTHNPGLAREIYLRSRTPHDRRLFGIRQRGPQPCGRLSEGTFVSLY